MLIKMKKNIIILFVIVALVSVVAYLWYSEKQQENIPDDQTFHIENTDAVTKIMMADKTGKKVLLEKKEGAWFVNEKHKAYPAKIKLLLETMNRIRVDFPVSEKQLNTVIKNLSQKSTRVEIYLNNESTPAQVYYVGYETLNGLGTYMITEQNGRVAKRPYVTHIPGFNGNLVARYFLDERDWRDLNIFDFKIDDIKEVSVKWLEEPDHSFSFLKAARDSFFMPENAFNEPLFKTGVSRFLSSFTFLNAEAIENENPLKDSVLMQSPFLEIQVKPVSGNPVTMTFYHMAINKRSKTQFDERGNPMPYDIDRYWAVVDNGLGFVVIQDYVFGKVMRRKYDFIARKL
jgi:ribosomal protein S11